MWQHPRLLGGSGSPSKFPVSGHPRQNADVAVAADPLIVLDNVMFCAHKGAAKAPALRGPLTAADAPAHTDRMQSVR